MTKDLRNEIIEALPPFQDGYILPEDVADAILAKLDPDALAHPLRVKPLVWEGMGDWHHIAQNPFGECWIKHYAGNDYWDLYGPNHYGVGNHFPTLEAAKAAAQADYETRIRAALETAEAPDTDALIVAALERSAGYISRAIDCVTSGTYDQSDPRIEQLCEYADDIRAIAADPEARAAIKTKAGWD